MRQSALSLWLGVLLALAAGAAQAACLCGAPALSAAHAGHSVSQSAHAGHAGEATPTCHDSAAECPDAHSGWTAAAPELVSVVFSAAAAILPQTLSADPAPGPAPDAAPAAPRPPPLRTTPVSRRTTLLI